MTSSPFLAMMCRQARQVGARRAVIYAPTLFSCWCVRVCERARVSVCEIPSHGVKERLRACGLLIPAWVSLEG